MQSETRDFAWLLKVTSCETKSFHLKKAIIFSFSLRPIHDTLSIYLVEEHESSSSTLNFYFFVTSFLSLSACLSALLAKLLKPSLAEHWFHKSSISMEILSGTDFLHWLYWSHFSLPQRSETVAEKPGIPFQNIMFVRMMVKNWWFICNYCKEIFP